jgi:hypothetical protein
VTNEQLLPLVFLLSDLADGGVAALIKFDGSRHKTRPLPFAGQLRLCTFWADEWIKTFGTLPRFHVIHSRNSSPRDGKGGAALGRGPSFNTAHGLNRSWRSRGGRIYNTSNRGTRIRDHITAIRAPGS